MRSAVESGVFRRLDPAYSRFVEQLRASKVTASSEVARTFRFAGDIGRISIRPGATEVPGAGGRVHALVLCHHGMLSIVSRCFGNDLRARPRRYLFAKALAHCLELYFVLCSRHAGRTAARSAAFVREAEKKYNRASAIQARPWKRQLQVAARDPFRSYKEACRELLAYYLVLLRAPKGDARAKAVEDVLRFRYLLFFHDVDVSMDVLFARCHFGVDAAGTADDADLRFVMDALDRSSTLLEFVDTIGAAPRRRTATSAASSRMRMWL